MMSKPRYRVFVSYSHDWSEMAQEIVGHLRDALQLDAYCDSSLQPGAPFTDEIKEQIARAHVFLPLLTKNIRKRPWVNQEIGYALGLRVPVLPVALGRLPGGMAQSLQAIDIPKHCRWSDDDRSRRRVRRKAGLTAALAQLLPRERIERLVERGREQPSANFEWADSLELRTEMIVRGARWVRSRSGPAMIRQVAVLSSFSLPDKPPEHKIWDEIEGQDASCDYGRRLLAQERQILDEHACHAGCRLLLFPWLNRESASPQRTQARIKVLIEGLKKIDAAPAEGEKLVAIIEPSPLPTEDDAKAAELSAKKAGRNARNLLIIGDWFAAESAVRLPGTGYQQTIATWHAGTVWNWLEEFDARFERLKEYHRSPSQAAEQLERICKNITD